VVRTEPQRAITPEPVPPLPVPDATDAPGAAALVIPPTELLWRANRPTDDYYPASSVSMGEEGVAVVRVCVGPTGRIEGRPTIRTTSRSRRLDEAAIRWASEALEFTPATRNGAAVPDCKDFRVLFNLR
jgi:protein TonB